MFGMTPSDRQKLIELLDQDFTHLTPAFAGDETTNVQKFYDTLKANIANPEYQLTPVDVANLVALIDSSNDKSYKEIRKRLTDRATVEGYY